MNNACFVTDQFSITQDPKMPFLDEVICPDKIKEMFKNHLSLDIKNYNLTQIKVIRYKPQKRCLIEYHFQGKETLILIGKIRAKGTDIKSYEIQQQLWQNGFNEQSLDNIAVPEPIGIIKPWQMWVQKKVEGHLIISEFSTKRSLEISQKVAQIANKLHTANIPFHRRHTITEELDILEKKLPLTLLKYPQWQHRIDSLLDKCYHLSQSMAEKQLCGIHRDFYFDQILVNQDKFYLLDLDLYCQGNPCLDIGNFIGHLTEYSIRKLGKIDGLKEQEKALQQEFVKLAIATNNYSHFLDPILTFNQEINAYTTLTLVRHIYLSTQFLERHSYTKTLLNLCEERLKQL